MEWDIAFRDYLKALEAEGKPVIASGDLNVAHQEIDLARPKTNHQTDTYSWWSYRAGARRNNVGWRIDYWLTSASLTPKLTSASINDDVLGSDHCPVTLEIDL